MVGNLTEEISQHDGVVINLKHHNFVPELIFPGHLLEGRSIIYGHIYIYIRLMCFFISKYNVCSQKRDHDMMGLSSVWRIIICLGIDLHWTYWNGDLIWTYVLDSLIH